VRLSGQWEAQRRWKRELVRRVEEAALRHPRAAALRLWDFSKAEGPTVEEVPAAGAKAAGMRWYWDSAHFKPALGERVLARLLGEAGADARFGNGPSVRDPGRASSTMLVDGAGPLGELAPGDVEELAALWREVQAGAAGAPCGRAGAGVRGRA
jgi:hypothetical protein